jgi:hypothetical protein
MSRDEDRRQPAKGQQRTATAWGPAGAREQGGRPGAQIRFTPGRRTVEKDVYHEACRQKLLAWDPVMFGGVGPGELVLMRCPHPRCVYGGVDIDEVREHFDRSGHYDPDVDGLDWSIINPLYEGEEPRTDGAYA